MVIIGIICVAAMSSQPASLEMDQLSRSELSGILDMREGLDGPCQKAIEEAVMALCKIQWPTDLAGAEYEALIKKGGRPASSGRTMTTSDIDHLSELARQCLDRQGPDAAVELHYLAGKLIAEGCWSAALPESMSGHWAELAFKQHEFAAAAELVRGERRAGWQELQTLLQETAAILTDAVEGRTGDLIMLEQAAAGTHMEEVLAFDRRLHMASRWQDWTMRYCFEGRRFHEGIAVLEFVAANLAGSDGEEPGKQSSVVRRLGGALMSLEAVVGETASMGLEFLHAHRQPLEEAGWQIVEQGRVDGEMIMQHLNRSTGLPIVLTGKSELLLKAGEDLVVPAGAQVWLARGTKARIQRGAGRLLVEGDLHVVGPGGASVEFHGSQGWGGIVLRGSSQNLSDISVKGARVGFGIQHSRWRWCGLLRCSIIDCSFGIAGVPRESDPADVETWAQAWLWVEDVEIRNCERAGLVVSGFCGLARSSIVDCGVGLIAGNWSEVVMASCRLKGCVLPIRHLGSDGVTRAVITRSAIESQKSREPRVEHVDARTLLFLGNYWGGRSFKGEFTRYIGDLASDLADLPPPTDESPLVARPEYIGATR